MENPRLFISYSWSSPEHEEWVIQLAEELVQNGVDVKLDKWDLKEGNDAYAFMESMVTDNEIKKVIVVCDKVYSQKADKRTGGAGTEAQIISQKVYEQVDQNKFIAVIKEKDENEKAYTPVFFKSRIYIDLSDNDLYVKNFEQLLRWVYDKPIYVKPELGKKLSFLSDESHHISLGTSSKFKKAIDAIRNGKSFAKGALQEYFDTFIENLEKFRIMRNNNEIDFDERIIKNIEEFIPYRNEVIELFLAIAQYSNTKETHHQVHDFFENILPYTERPEHINQYHTFDFDNYKFIIHELFLYAIASLLKYECFDAVSTLINQDYYNKIDDSYNQNSMISFSKFRSYCQSLEYRKDRLKLNRLSLKSDLIKERSEGMGIKFEQLMQSDFILYLRSSIDYRSYSDLRWYPDTLLYARNRYKPFELLARAQSKDYISKLHILFNLDDKNKFKNLVENIIKNNFVPSWDYDSIPLETLMNLKNLYTKEI